MRSERCANTEALDKYEREIAKADREYERERADMFDELDDLLEEYKKIAKRYSMEDEAKQYMEDMI